MGAYVLADVMGAKRPFPLSVYDCEGPRPGVAGPPNPPTAPPRGTGPVDRVNASCLVTPARTHDRVSIAVPARGWTAKRGSALGATEASRAGAVAGDG